MSQREIALKIKISQEYPVYKLLYIHHRNILHELEKIFF